MILALALRVAVIAADSGYEPAHDAFDYDRHARAIAAGDGYPESGYVVDGGPSALRPPGYPYFLGGAYALSGDSVELGRLANAALGALAVLLLYLLANRIWGRRVGLVAAALAAVFPPLVLPSRDLLSEPLFIAIEARGRPLRAQLARPRGAPLGGCRRRPLRARRPHPQPGDRARDPDRARGVDAAPGAQRQGARGARDGCSSARRW